MLTLPHDPARCRVAAAACVVLLAAACSTLPEPSYPPFAEQLVAADFVVPDSGLLRLPATTRDLVVQELAAQPLPQREQFGGDGERWLCYPAGTAVHVQCRYRSYAPPGGQPLAPEQVLTGASHLELLATP